jgi:hypothetical protein
VAKLRIVTNLSNCASKAQVRVSSFLTGLVEFQTLLRRKRNSLMPWGQSYANAVNFYNSAGSLARFENKNIFFFYEKRSSLLQRWRCSCKFKSRRIGSSSLQRFENKNIFFYFLKNDLAYYNTSRRIGS